MSDVWSISYGELALRLVVAAVLGGIVGWERELNNSPAGFRTHILVSVGSALIMLISIYGFSEFMQEPRVTFDPGRISAQVVSGIGFLGAGTILRQGVTVSGLTTAASLWVVAGIGLAVGTGFMFAAVLTTMIALISLELLNRIETGMLKKRSLCVIHVTVIDEPGKLGELASCIAEQGGNVRRVKIEERDKDVAEELDITFMVRLSERMAIAELLDQIRQIRGVKKVRSEGYER
ncbi:MgtC/SapB family protein [Thermoflavimicrobium dichotomicum]|uniref:Putative Mg2+ transporter-C (MgtC) family protein n=1 Tax=Thermoflavimicrobium dichotomicum TaxID=46223 RepID=A0A1I3QU41_9BACL|nr:MgtC/SapB family protein [Thermoflavimicrobium dichotomicum]SFJ36972.1 putative Mg2+ transporter-C (MgtC) family protein [Thermoflavimicrobium dichotomicum]